MRSGTFNGTRRVHLYWFIFMPCDALLRSVISPPTMVSNHIANRSKAASQELEHLLSDIRQSDLNLNHYLRRQTRHFTLEQLRPSSSNAYSVHDIAR